MAKKKKLPKMPKQSASLEVWRRYEQRVKEVKQYNQQLERDKAAKKSLISRLRKERAKL